MACGICCDGSLFDIVRLEQGESARAFRRYGLKIKNNQFPQPCAVLDGCICMIYEKRPNRCREFNCQLINKRNSGTIAFELALSIVLEVKSQIVILKNLLREIDYFNSRKSLASMCFAAEMSMPEAETQKQLIVDIRAAFVRLNEFLDLYFRCEVVSSK
jgi:uncharacterized protein